MRSLRFPVNCTKRFLIHSWVTLQSLTIQATQFADTCHPHSESYHIKCIYKYVSKSAVILRWNLLIDLWVVDQIYIFCVTQLFGNNTKFLPVRDRSLWLFSLHKFEISVKSHTRDPEHLNLAGLLGMVHGWILMRRQSKFKSICS